MRCCAHDRGFNPHNVLTFAVNLPDNSYPNDKDDPNKNSGADKFSREFRDRLREVPGVLDVASSTVIPATNSGSTIRFLIEGRPKPLGQEDECNIVEVSRGYFSTLKISLLEGRYFNEDDAKPGAEEVVVVSRTFAKAYFPGESALNKRVRYTYDPKSPYRRIIGVVADTALIDLDQPPPAVIFELNEHSGDTYLSYIVRTNGDPLSDSRRRARNPSQSRSAAPAHPAAHARTKSRSKLHPYFCAAIRRCSSAASPDSP